MGLRNSPLSFFMKPKDIGNILGTIALAVGFFFALAPHAFHTAVGFGEQSHTEHVILGFAIVLASLAYLTYNNKALKSWKELTKPVKKLTKS